ncbi:hypothetical protein [Kribbella deserti]|uniref:Uncharacterized protein n=1 Tax=Kribbella deserti TaxID=1926257 RepID=A0ABV6QRC4_9ACTN
MTTYPENDYGAACMKALGDATGYTAVEARAAAETNLKRLRETS